MAEEINGHYGTSPLTIIGVLTGSVVFLADLIRLLEMPLKVGLVQARSYQGATTTPGELRIHHDILPEVTGHDVLIVDDIFDTGHTLMALIDQFVALGPATVRSVVLLRKAGRVRVALQPDHVGFEIPNEFVVGYGLDYDDLYRNLPHVAALDPTDLAPAPPTASASGQRS